LAAGGALDTWDGVTKQRTLSQTGGKRPTYWTVGVGRAAHARFAGSVQSATLNDSSFPGLAGGSFSAGIGWYQRTVAGVQSIIFDWASGLFNLFLDAGTGTLKLKSPAGVLPFGGPNIATGEHRGVLVCDATAGKARFFLDGAQLGTDINYAGQRITNMLFGCDNSNDQWNADVWRVAFFNGALGGGDVGLLDCWLNVPRALDCVAMIAQSNGCGTVDLANVKAPNQPGVSCLAGGVAGPEILSWSGTALAQADGNARNNQDFGANLSRASCGLGMAHLARRLKARHGLPIVVANHAAAGLAIADWDPGAPIPPGFTVNRYNTLMSAIVSSGANLRVLLFDIGEQDAALGTPQASFYSTWQTIYNAARLANPALEQIIIRKTLVAPNGQNSTSVRAAWDQVDQIYSVAAPSARALIVDELANKVVFIDAANLHFNYPGQQALAAGYDNLLS
jgi:hypothetical protein